MSQSQVDKKKLESRTWVWNLFFKGKASELGEFVNLRYFDNGSVVTSPLGKAFDLCTALPNRHWRCENLKRREKRKILCQTIQKLKPLMNGAINHCCI